MTSSSTPAASRASPRFFSFAYGIKGTIQNFSRSQAAAPPALHPVLAQADACRLTSPFAHRQFLGVAHFLSSGFMCFRVSPCRYPARHPIQQLRFPSSMRRCDLRFSKLRRCPQAGLNGLSLLARSQWVSVRNVFVTGDQDLLRVGHNADMQIVKMSDLIQCGRFQSR